MPKATPSRTRQTATPRRAARPDEPATRRRNLPAKERKRELLNAAMELFAARGMGITIQSLADHVHVTQPLVHRYFPTKADLIDSIRHELREAHWDPKWRELLSDRARPLTERIPDFYARYLPHIHRPVWYRGFWHAALNDPNFAKAYLRRVDQELLYTIIDEARFSHGFVGVDTQPPHEREIELVWGMHSTMIFMGIRRYVYETATSLDVDGIVRDQLRAYLSVVPRVMQELGLGKRAMPQRRNGRSSPSAAEPAIRPD